ncbi:MAG TPA: carboxypeptidase regulatory-like domain-containing protein, partial [Tenuifilaceae bacterium]|nr:carboxypeptidase regulatory-like domain-containing protein [Tenuifilaceae bacterium]
MYKRFLLLIGAALISASTFAFSAPVDEGAPKGTIKGFVYDSLAKQPLEYATISLTSTTTGKVVTGTITDNSGFFRIKGLEFGIYNVEITFIGYNAKNLGQVKVTGKEREIDLGQIHLTPNINEMDEVVVVADRPTMTYKIDKKVINVSQQHTSASGTAVELLESIPSITVSIDGDVSLRGSTSFSVLIDGKPSVLSASDVLAQIPASQIENIEIITNPSAKFDPDGVAGIINIIMKKNRLQGVSGIANINVGTQNQYGADVLLTYRKEKFNYFLGVDYNNRGRFGESTTKNETTKDDTTRY